MKYLVVIAAVIATVSAQCGPKQQSEKCSYKGKTIPHSACLRQECTRPQVTSDDSSFVQQILDEHNKIRSSIANGQDAQVNAVAPGSRGATNMMQMQWDAGLARTALNWAKNLCHNDEALGHDAGNCRNTDKFSWVGQNVAWSAASGNRELTANWPKAIKGWYDEVKDMNDQAVRKSGSQTSGVVGHFTQVAWAKSYTVGCAFVAWEYNKSFKGTQGVYVCNYGPGGNFNNEAVWTAGSAASACPAGSSRSGALCKMN